ncbi:MAG: glycosyltransferase, partial [Pyrinomonadaceae bacterium]
MTPKKELQDDLDISCPCLSVVMPAYNEVMTIRLIVEKVMAVPHLLELIIVDDASTDRTSEIANEIADSDPRIKYVRHETNKGKTEALKTAF